MDEGVLVKPSTKALADGLVDAIKEHIRREVAEVQRHTLETETRAAERLEALEARVRLLESEREEKAQDADSRWLKAV